MKEVTPERLSQRALHALAHGEPSRAAYFARALVELAPDDPTGWATLRGALAVQGQPSDVEALKGLPAADAPGAAAIIDRVADSRLSKRGLIFDPQDPCLLRPAADVLRPAQTAQALRSQPNVVHVLDPGGDLVERHPVLELDGAGGGDVTVRYRTGAKFIASLEAPVLIGEGLVLTRDGDLIEEVRPPAKPAKYGARWQGDGIAFEPGAYAGGQLPVKVFDQPGFLMAGPTDTSFGDWIVNFAPRLALYEAAGLDCPLVLRWKPPPQVLPLLEALGFGPDRIVFHTAKQVSLFPRLYAPSWPSRDKGAPMADVFGVYRRAWLPPPSRSPLIYLTREGVSARPLVNEPEVCRLFAGRGFEIVNPGELSLDEVRRLFAAPACVAGPFGSALHNLVFSANHPPSLVLMPAHLPYHLVETALWQADCGNRFAYVLGETPPEPHGSLTPWTISLPKLETALDRMLEAIAAGTVRS